MNFVKLTMERDMPVFVNMDRVCELFVQSNGMTLLVYSDEVSTTVKETPEQIMSWIITGKLE